MLTLLPSRGRRTLGSAFNRLPDHEVWEIGRTHALGDQPDAIGSAGAPIACEGPDRQEAQRNS